MQDKHNNDVRYTCLYAFTIADVYLRTYARILNTVFLPPPPPPMKIERDNHELRQLAHVCTLILQGKHTQLFLLRYHTYVPMYLVCT